VGALTPDLHPESFFSLTIPPPLFSLCAEKNEPSRVFFFRVMRWLCSPAFFRFSPMPPALPAYPSPALPRSASLAAFRRAVSFLVPIFDLQMNFSSASPIRAAGFFFALPTALGTLVPHEALLSIFCHRILTPDHPLLVLTPTHFFASRSAPPRSRPFFSCWLPRFFLPLPLRPVKSRPRSRPLPNQASPFSPPPDPSPPMVALRISGFFSTVICFSIRRFGS